MSSSVLPAREAARLLGVSAETLRRRARRGRLQARLFRGRWFYPSGEIEVVRRLGPAWMTSGQAARLLRRCRKTVNAWADAGLVVCRRGPGQRRWFQRASVVAVAWALGGRRRMAADDLAGRLSEATRHRARLGSGSWPGMAGPKRRRRS
jgi:predicted site-specific integrase-resolvase